MVANLDFLAAALLPSLDWHEQDNPVERISRLLEQRDGQLVTHQFDDVLTLNDVFERGYQVSSK